MTEARAAGPISARGVCRSFDTGGARLTVLDGVDLDVREGELVLLMGPSGSGKTTLLSILAGLLRPDAGRVTLCGAEVSAMSEVEVARVRRANVGFVFQGFHLFEALSARDNVAEVLAMKGMRLSDARARAQASLSDVGLAERASHLPRQLSTGQKQRVAIARALAGDPRVVFCDEPTAALDHASAEGVMELLRAQIRGTRSALVVTHDPRLARYADRVVPLEDGRLGAPSTPASPLAPPPASVPASPPMEGSP